MRKSHDSVFTIGIGGAAGDGIKESGATVGAILAELGYESYLSFTYPSLIRGGHNFARITFSKDKVYSDHEALDALIALNEETIKVHRDELAENAVVLADSFEQQDIEVLKDNAVVIPMAVTVKEMNVPAITRNSMALGAICYLLDLDFDLMQKVLGDVFKNKMPQANIELADRGYKLMKEKGFRHQKKISPSAGKKESVDGNEAFGRGLMAAGLDFYVGYPMTPATSILHFLASQQKDSGLRVIQPESELSVINMALGMAYAGKRVAIGSASGGFALMQEAFSFAGMAELPLVVAVSQRQAPATGLPTYSSQTDMRFAIHAGHGEFQRIVVAPGDAEESFALGAQALNLAWGYQLPVIVLMDKIISEHASTCLLKPETIKIDRGLLVTEQGTIKISDESTTDATGAVKATPMVAKAEATDNESLTVLQSTGTPAHKQAATALQSIRNGSIANYGRYQITADGISPMAFPGTPGTVVKVTSYEHDEAGITVDELEPTKAMLDKRFAKSETLRKSLDHHETVKVYGDKDSKDVIVFWGSTKGPVLEAARYIEKPVKFVQIVWLEPFDAKKVAQELSGAKKIINIECNRDGQMAALIREKTGIEATDMILRCDSRPFEPVSLAEEINERLK